MWDHTKLESFCIAKYTANKLKNKRTEWEKIFKLHISNKRLISKMYGELIQFNSKRKKNHITQFKNGQMTNRCFSKEDI